MKASVTVLLLLSVFELSFSVYRLHFLVNEIKSWTDAQKHCRLHFDDLSTVRSKDLQMLSNNPQLNQNYFWIGLQRDSKNQDKWRWSEGGEAMIELFDSELHNYDEKCAAVDKNNYKLYDGDCSVRLNFYCMTVFELILVQQESTWEEALKYCRQNHIDLAVLSSDDRMEEAQINSTASDTDELWTGLRFIAARWFWVNGEGLGYKVWTGPDGEPQCPAMDQRCGVYDRTQNAWKPTDCEQRLNFLCVKKGYYIYRR